jgi:hypothetical protein
MALGPVIPVLVATAASAMLAGFGTIKCKIYECCTDDWVKPNITGKFLCSNETPIEIWWWGVCIRTDSLHFFWPFGSTDTDRQAIIISFTFHPLIDPIILTSIPPPHNKPFTII